MASHLHLDLWILAEQGILKMAGIRRVGQDFWDVGNIDSRSTVACETSFLQKEQEQSQPHHQHNHNLSLKMCSARE